jgi:polysaccharide pyruvyl transferase CsaB
MPTGNSIGPRSMPDKLHEFQPHVVISGYYGFGNLGDELILTVLTQQLRKRRNVRITVLSANPRYTADHYGVEAIKRTDPTSILKSFSTADLFISGGGGLFQDATGPMSVIYYGGLIMMARFFGIKTCFWSQGIGPLKRNFSQMMTKWALNACNTITVRDEASAQLVFDLTGIDAEVTSDPVWLLELPKQPDVRKASPTWNIGISLREWGDLTDERLKHFVDFMARLTDGSERPIKFLLFSFQPAQDDEVLQKFETGMREAGDYRQFERVPPEAIIYRMQECHLLFGMRFHSLILAILAGVPIYGLVYDPKLRSLLEHLELQGMDIPQLDKLQVGNIRTYFNNYIPPDLKALRERSAVNFQRLEELLDRPGSR